jgi:hypothetical protein
MIASHLPAYSYTSCNSPPTPSWDRYSPRESAHTTDTSPRALCVRSRHGLVLSGCLSVFVITQTVSRRSGLNVGAAHAYSESNFIIITTTTVIMRTVHVFLAEREIPRAFKGPRFKVQGHLKTDTVAGLQDSSVKFCGHKTIKRNNSQ